MPVAAPPGSNDGGGGASSRGAVMPVMACSLRASRGSSISSSLRGGGHSSRPAMMADSCGRSMRGARPVGGDDLAAPELPRRRTRVKRDDRTRQVAERGAAYHASQR